MVKGFRKAEIAAWCRQHFTEGSVVISAGLACFNAVTKSGCRMIRLCAIAGERPSKSPSSIG